MQGRCGSSTVGVLGFSSSWSPSTKGWTFPSGPSWLQTPTVAFQAAWWRREHRRRWPSSPSKGASRSLCSYSGAAPRLARLGALLPQRNSGSAPQEGEKDGRGARPFVFFTIPTLAVFSENCLGVGAHLYTLNSSSYLHSTRGFPQSILDVGAGTRMRHHGHKIKQLVLRVTQALQQVLS